MSWWMAFTVRYVHNGLRDWFDSGAERVFEGALWVHKAANPLLDMDALRAKTTRS